MMECKLMKVMNKAQIREWQSLKAENRIRNRRPKESDIPGNIVGKAFEQRQEYRLTKVTNNRQTLHLQYRKGQNQLRMSMPQ
jgi:hypothetical protein